MENQEQTSEVIDLYLKGKLSGYDKIHFEEQLLTNSELAQEVRFQKAANNVIINRQLELLKKRMEKDLSDNSFSRNFSKGLWALALSIIAGGFLILYSSSDSIKDKKDPSNNETSVLTTTDKEPELRNAPSQSSTEHQSDKIVEKNDASLIVVENDTLISFTYPEKTIAAMEAKEEKRDNFQDLSALNKTSSPDKTFHCQEHPSLSTADIVASCKGKDDGEIVLDIQHVKGGTIPYQYSLDNGKNFSENYIFRQLEAGTYNILIKDKNNCIGNMVVIVPEKKCQEVLHYVLNPLNGNWKIPVAENHSGELKIFSKTGILVFSRSVSGNQENEWDGKSDTGLLLPQGYYAFIIRYDNGEESTGYISIMY